MRPCVRACSGPMNYYIVLVVLILVGHAIGTVVAAGKRSERAEVRLRPALDECRLRVVWVAG